MVKIKICGLTCKEQAQAIADLGVDYGGFIVVPGTPRYVPASRLPALTSQLVGIQKVGVFRHPSLPELTEIVQTSSLDCIQLHGQESPTFCQQLKHLLPNKTIIKAIGVKQKQDLEIALEYSKIVDIILLDGAGGGTGKTIDWQMLDNFRPHCPWWLAGGITPQNARNAIETTKANGIDLSSGVEDAPGIKNIAKIKDLLLNLA